MEKVVNCVRILLPSLIWKFLNLPILRSFYRIFG